MTRLLLDIEVRPPVSALRLKADIVEGLGISVKCQNLPSKAGGALVSDVNLFGNRKRIIYFNAEVASRALDLRMTKKELDGS